MQSRFYNPAQARFLQQDSVLGKTSDPLSLHLYTYCKNNPISYYDPTGHAYISVPIQGQYKPTVTTPTKTTTEVRKTNEANGSTVSWSQGSGKGQSTITVTTKGSSSTLKEGEDYTIGSDGKAYYTTPTTQSSSNTNASKPSTTVTSSSGSSSSNTQKGTLVSVALASGAKAAGKLMPAGNLSVSNSNTIGIAVTPRPSLLVSIRDFAELRNGSVTWDAISGTSTFTLND